MAVISESAPGNISYDVIVIGVGSMGSSACYFLSKRGYKVLGLEQFDIPHEQGSHAGQSRIIRKAYFEHPDYVPLLTRAYDNWNALEEETNSKIYYRTGLVYSGRPEDPVIKGVKESASLYQVPVEKLDTQWLTKTFPQFRIPLHFEALLEPDAGFVTPERAILIYTEQAIRNGATIHTKEKVMDWEKIGNSIMVTTHGNKYQCRKLVITAGAWAGKMIPGFHQQLKITRQTIAWVKPNKWDQFSYGRFPCWLFADDESALGVYYGFPILPVAEFGGPIGLKVAHHYPDTVTDPDQVNREIGAKDVEKLRYILDKYFPDAFTSVLSTKTCLYANSPDENFIIDKLPDYEDHVVIACGFSGHGFKFVSVVGEILTDLALEGKTNHQIGFLAANRFG
jgi:sarcosine oxidase